MKKLVAVGVLLGCAGCVEIGAEATPDPCEGVVCEPGVTVCEAGTCVAIPCTEKAWYPDADGDGVGGLSSELSCEAPAAGWVQTTGDCYDDDPQYVAATCSSGFDAACEPTEIDSCAWGTAELSFSAVLGEAGSFGESFAVGDFDGDGAPDLAVSYGRGPNTIGIFWGPLVGAAGPSTEPDLRIEAPAHRSSLGRRLVNLGPVGPAGDALGLRVIDGPTVSSDDARFVRGVVVLGGERSRFARVEQVVADPTATVEGILPVLARSEQVDLFPFGDPDATGPDSVHGLAIVQHRGVDPVMNLSIGYRVRLLDRLDPSAPDIDLTTDGPDVVALELAEESGEVTVLATADLIGDRQVDIAIGLVPEVIGQLGRGVLYLAEGPFAAGTRSLEPVLREDAPAAGKVGSSLGRSLAARARGTDVELWVSASGRTPVPSSFEPGRVHAFRVESGPSLVEVGSLLGPGKARWFGDSLDVDRTGRLLTGAVRYGEVDNLLQAAVLTIPPDWSPAGESIVAKEDPFTFYTYFQDDDLHASLEDVDGDGLEDVAIANVTGQTLRFFLSTPRSR